MKRFVRNIAIFSIILLAVFLVEDALTTCAFHKKRTRKYEVWNDIIHKDLRADVLIMGNSRAWCQYSPLIIDSVFGTCSYNLGMDGSCFDRQLARYDIYRHYQRQAPKYIIQNMDFFTLARTKGYEREQFMPYLMYPYFRERISEIESFGFGELYIPMYRYYKNNVYEEYTKYDYPLVKGFFPMNNVWDGMEMKQMKPYRQEVDTNTLNMFVQYIEGVQREGIKLVFVVAPLYKDAMSIVLNGKEIHGLFDQLAQEYDIPILDYADCWLSRDTTYFGNATHLNKLGSELFSLKLCHDLDSLGFLPKKESQNSLAQ